MHTNTHKDLPAANQQQKKLDVRLGQQAAQCAFGANPYRVAPTGKRPVRSS